MNTDYTMPGGMLRKARDLAKSNFLIGVDYLDSEGNVGARGENVDCIRLTFDNAEVVNITDMEFKMLDDVKFKMKENKNV